MSFYTKFAQHYEMIFPFSQGIADFLVRYSGGARHCLDVGCGSGHYAGYLATQGYAVTGLDLDAAMIAYARMHYHDVAFYCMDMRHIKVFTAGYDFIYCIGNSGAHLPRDDFRQFVTDLRTMLTPGGTWILQLMNWDYVLKQNQVTFPVIETENNLTFKRVYSRISAESVQFETSLFSGNDMIFEETVPLYPLLTKEVVQIHADLGFVCKAHYANYAGGMFYPDVFSANLFVFSVPAA
jgi:SAM-dependent methyltransferase